MKNTFINGLGCVSAQNTFDANFLENAHFNDNVTILNAQQPSYKELIPPAMIRRMAKGVKMGIFASTQAMNEANITYPDAIITGTGMGCTEDSEKFLKAILDNNEQFLTPTSFIQSTHNTVAGQIALGMQCKSYNFTYVNGGVSLESALIDAKLQLENNEAQSILVGGIDEMADHTIKLYQLVNLIKKESDCPVQIKNANSNGVVFSEGATFFALENNQKETSYAKIVDVKIQNKLEVNQVHNFINSFLAENKLTTNDIDAVILGNNGDLEFENYYTEAANLFTETSQVFYKHLSGEYYTATGFGLWCAAKIIKSQEIPTIISLNNQFKTEYKNVLIYNQYRGLDHSLTLISKC